MKNIKVSIVCISYNQEKYIAQALEGFVSQKARFNFEAIIADDCSTDSTQKIINDYAKKYPNIIKPVLRKKNVGVQANLIDALKRATGDYIALCEGDDFWTDDLKLQKQADFLDAHESYGLVFHPVRVIFENHEEEDAIFPETADRKHFTTKNLLKNNYIQTNSVMYRKTNYDRLPTDIMPFDWYLHLLHARNGKIGFINDVMSAYRRHNGGIWWSQRSKPQLIWKKYGYNYLRLLHEIMLLHGNSLDNIKIINNHIAGSYEAIASVLPKNTTDGIAIRSVGEMPSEAWDYIKYLMQQVEHYSKHDNYLQGVLDSETPRYEEEIRRLLNESKQLSKELNNIKSSKAWRVISIVRLGKRYISLSANSIKHIIRKTSISVENNKK